MYHRPRWNCPERISSMSKIDRTIQRNDEECLTFDVSDEALETAASTETIANYTYHSCTFYYCGGY
jgi:hypothetical protein